MIRLLLVVVVVIVVVGLGTIHGKITDKPLAVQNEIDPQLTPYLAQTEPIPDQVRIVNFQADAQNAKRSGTGYYAEVGGEIPIITVRHVIFSGQLIIRPIGETVGKFALFSYGCAIVAPLNTAKNNEPDGSCQLFQSDVSRSNIIRDVSSIPEEVSIYNRFLGIWMPFKVVKITRSGFEAISLPVDRDGDGFTDFNSNVCGGMSGSEAVESDHGALLQNEAGKLVSRGELVAMSDIYGERCGFRITIINPEFDFSNRQE